MRIAYITFEYPPDTAFGGIATYVYQAAHLMASRGHSVEVFSASGDREGSEQDGKIIVHRSRTSNRQLFKEQVLTHFSARHSILPFDIFESPEYCADGLEIKRAFPHLPLVVKLHTPNALVNQLDKFYLSKTTSAYIKLKYIVGGLLKGERRKRYWVAKRWVPKELDDDYLITSLADQIHTPSVSLGDIVSKKWSIPRTRIIDLPYPFIPHNKLLSIDLDSNLNTVTFIGRMEVRKGITVLVDAVPIILKALPKTNFLFVGRNCASSIPGMDMQTYIEKRLKIYTANISFLSVSNDEIPNILNRTSVCVFPSIWENFPNVCLEAMSAGRAIVGSKEGGMKDMLEETASGILVDPLDHLEIATAIIKLLKNKDLRRKFGSNARERVLNYYNAERIGKMMESNYRLIVK